MSQPDVATLMMQDLMENHRDDFNGAIIKIEEWRLMVNVLERLVLIARDHPDGWEHVSKMFANHDFTG